MSPLDRYAEPDPCEPTAMDALTALAREAGELRIGDDDGLVSVTHMVGRWHITIQVNVPEALPHCTKIYSPTWGVIDVTAETLDAAVTEAARRVAAAVADTPATQIP